MDWATHDHKPPPRQDPPAPALLEACWRLRSTRTARVLTCGIYAVQGPGVELRCGFSGDDLLMSQRVTDLEAARKLAADWMARAIAKADYVEV